MRPYVLGFCADSPHLGLRGLRRAQMNYISLLHKRRMFASYELKFTLLNKKGGHLVAFVAVGAPAPRSAFIISGIKVKCVHLEIYCRQR